MDLRHWSQSKNNNETHIDRINTFLRSIHKIGIAIAEVDIRLIFWIQKNE